MLWVSLEDLSVISITVWWETPVFPHRLHDIAHKIIRLLRFGTTWSLPAVYQRKRYTVAEVMDLKE